MRAAKKKRIKNKADHKNPAGIFAKTTGKVIKVKPAPAAGSMLKANREGKIIRPAIIEIRRVRKHI